jgi:hypothetical protein
MGEPAGVDIKTLTAPQLQQLGEQLEGELNTLSESFQSLQAAVTRFYQSGTALEALAEEAEGTPMMVPLTESLYAPGKLGSTDKVLLDIGTGYFVEVRGWRLRRQHCGWRLQRQHCAALTRPPARAQYTPADGVDFCRRKVNLLRENVDKLGEARAARRTAALGGACADRAALARRVVGC